MGLLKNIAFGALFGTHLVLNSVLRGAAGLGGKYLVSHLTHCIRHAYVSFNFFYPTGTSWALTLLGDWQTVILIAHYS